MEFEDGPAEEKLPGIVAAPGKPEETPDSAGPWKNSLADAPRPSIVSAFVRVAFRAEEVEKVIGYPFRQTVLGRISSQPYCAEVLEYEKLAWLIRRRLVPQAVGWGGYVRPERIEPQSGARRRKRAGLLGQVNPHLS
ncbi:MAG: hypothetical protein ACE15C_18225 [Phycisphaerae bacterium]